MGYYHDTECNGCAECVGCGRQFRNIRVKFCDKCGNEVDKLYYDEKHREICWECYRDQFISKICDDMDETVCENCGYDAEEMFQVDGEWICESCMKDMAEEVE